MEEAQAMGQDDQFDKVTESTRQEEEKEAQSAHRADRPPTSEEEEVLSDEAVDDDVRSHYEEMATRGVEEKGEGRIP